MKEIRIDPVTRIEGHLGVRLVVDEETRKPIPETVRSFGTMFRGFEIFLRQRKVEDAIHVTSRICGVCGATHALASAYASDMALGTTPEPLGVALRNLAYGMADNIYDHSLILNMLGGPDYSEKIVKKYTPNIYSIAKEVYSPNRDYHGLTKIVDIMETLNPITGSIWKKTVHFQRIAREAAVLIWGRHPHPSTLIPGGIMTDLTNFDRLVIEYLSRLITLTSWVKYLVKIWEDLTWFFKEYGNYGEQGRTCVDEDCKKFPIMFSSGLFDDPEFYAMLGETPEDIYMNIDSNAKKRMLRPGFAEQNPIRLAGKDIIPYNVGVHEKVDHSFYQEWNNIYTETDYLGNTLLWGKENPKWHPWNKITIPKPEETNWTRKYTWVTTVRYLRKSGEKTPIELGPIARLSIAALQEYTISSSSATANFGNGKIKVELPKSREDPLLPKTVTEEVSMEYNIPRYSTTIERVWARAFNLSLDVAFMWVYLDWILEYLKKKKPIKTSKWQMTYPQKMTFGWGTVEAPRGTVNHWIVQQNGKIINYQIHAPTTINASAYDNAGYSPFDASVKNSVVTEESSPQEWSGLDFVRAIRSFDPCLACSIHVQFVGKNTQRLLKKHILPTQPTV